MSQNAAFASRPPLRFVHCADLHLDSPPPGIAGHSVPFRQASRLALERIVDTCLGEEVDFLLIAGDLYDRDLQDNAPLIFFNQQMHRLAEQRIPVFMIRGNHDAANKSIGGLLAPNVHLFLPGDPQTERRDFGGQAVAFHGWSYAQEAEPNFQISTYPEPVAGAINIGLLHTALEPQGPYAPCSPAQLFAKGYDYWALGHAHIEKRFAEGRCLIVNPGMPQGRAIDEEGSKGAYLVTISTGQPPEGCSFKTSSLDWRRLVIDARGLSSENDLERLIRRALNDLLNQGDAERWACRLQIEGAGPELYGQRYSIVDAMARLFDGSFDARVFIERVVMKPADHQPLVEPSASLAALAPFVQASDVAQGLEELSEALAKTLGALGRELDLPGLEAEVREADPTALLDQALRDGRDGRDDRPPGEGKR